MAERKSAPSVPAVIEDRLAFQDANIEQSLAALKHASGGHISMFDLTQWRVPAGGSTQWQVGNTRMDTLRGIILHHHPARNYWSMSYGEGRATPPDCQSQDGIVGVGNPGGECQVCPMSQFLMDSNPKCTQTYRLYVLPLEAVLPVHFQVPTMSIRVVRDYLKDLATKYGQFSYGVVTEFALETAKSQRGITYSQVRCSVVGFLDKVALTDISNYASSVSASMTPVRQVAAVAAPRPLFSDADDDIDDPAVPE
jgi:hypothetical protein